MLYPILKQQMQEHIDCRKAEEFSRINLRWLASVPIRSEKDSNSDHNPLVN